MGGAFMTIARTLLGATLTLVLFGSSVLAQQGASGIVGVVKDQSGGALPGVTVEVSSPNLIQGTRSTVTGASGDYRFLQLPPGTYSLRFTLTGFTAAKREGISLSSAFTATVDVVLQVGSMAETVIVQGTQPLVDVASTVSERPLKQELLEGVPVGRNAHQVAMFYPGATTTQPDVGGNQVVQIATLSIHGSDARDITWNENGIDLTNNVGRGGQTGMYYNEGFNQEISIQTKALPAEVSGGGVNFNMIKKEGSNTFHGNLQSSLTGKSFQANNVSATQQQLGLKAPSGINKAYDVNASVGGPILKNRMWFLGSVRRERVDRLVANTFNVDGTQAIDDQGLTNYSGSITYQVSKANRLIGFVDYYDKLRGHRRDLTSDYQFVAPEAAYLQHVIGHAITLRWTSTLRNNLLFEAGIGLMHIGWSTAPQPGLAPDALARDDITLSTLTGAAPNYMTLDQEGRRSVSLVATWTPNWHGSHNLRFGGDLPIPLPFDTAYATQGGRDLMARYSNGIPNSVIVYNTPIETPVSQVENGIFVQDSWSIKNRFTVNAGVRADFFRGTVEAINIPAGTFVPARQVQQIDNAPKWTNVLPRLAFVLDVFGDGKTALKWNASKYVEREGGGLMQLIDSARLLQETRSWIDSNGDGIPQLTEIGPSRGTLTQGATVSLDPNLKRGSQWEATVTLERQLSATLAVSVGYYWRKYYDQSATINAALQPSDYIPVTITNPLTGQPLTVYNQDPATVTKINNVLMNSDAISEWYRGFEVTIDKRMSHNLMLFGGFTISSFKQCGAGAASTNPNDQINACGYAPFDSKFIGTISGAYNLPYGFNVSGHLVYRTGQPLQPVYTVTRTIVPSLTQVNQNVFLLPAGSSSDWRYPNQRLFDLRLSRVFAIGAAHVEPLVDVYNIFNENAAVSQVQTIGSALGRISENINGRIVRIGLKVSF